MKPSTFEDYTQRMLRVLLYIQQHLDEPTPLEHLARIAAFSPYHFHRIFRGMVGEPVREHIRRLRLERAAVRLKLTRVPITQIAFEAGYDSHEAFTRAFRSTMGVTPSEFRVRNGLAPPLSPSRVHFCADGDLLDFEPLSPGGNAMQVEIVTRQPLRVAFVRHVGPYAECGTAWATLCARLGAEGRLGGDAQFVGLCHDDPEVTPPDRVRYDACCTVDATFEPAGDVGVTVIGGGEYVKTTHLGSFDGLKDTYAQLFGQWLPRSGRELRSAPSLEVYLTDPETTAPEDLVTEIYAPLEGSANSG